MWQDVERYEEYLREVKDKSENTVLSYIRDVKQFVGFMEERGILEPEKITEEDFLDYGNWIYANGASETTLSRKIVSVKAFYKYLYRNHSLLLDTVQVLVAPRTVRKQPALLTEEEIQRVLLLTEGNKPKKIRDKAIFRLLCETGMKASEMISLRREQLDLQMNYVTCGEGEDKRTIPFGEETRNALLQYLMEVRGKQETEFTERVVFLNTNGRPMSRQGLFKLIRTYGKMAGIEQEVTPTKIRQSFAGILLKNGARVEKVQEMMGHKGVGSTQVYKSLP